MFTDARGFMSEVLVGSATREGVSVGRVVAAARTLLRSGGIEAVTVRELGRALGVSAPALYKHVRGRAEIVDRLVAACLDELTAEVASARDAEPLPDPGVRFLAAGRAFAAWARANRAEFALVFATPVVGFAKLSDGPGEQAGVRLGRVFVEIAAQASAQIRDAGPLPAALSGPLAAWTARRDLGLSPGQAHTVVSAFGDLLGLVSVDVFGQLGFALPPSTTGPGPGPYLDLRLQEVADRVTAPATGALT